MDQIERSLEASSLFLAAEVLERAPLPFLTPWGMLNPGHISRIRAVASRMSIDLEEARLRREIEIPLVVSSCLPQPVLVERAIADLPGTESSNGDNDIAAYNRFMQLDRGPTTDRVAI